MEAALLMLEVVAISQVLIWVARGRGTSGFFGWKSDEPPPTDEPRRSWRERATNKTRKA